MKKAVKAILNVLSYGGIEVESARRLADIKKLDPIRIFLRKLDMGTSYNDHKLMIESFRMKDPFGAELAMKNNWNYSMLAVKAVNDKGSIA